MSLVQKVMVYLSTAATFCSMLVVTISIKVVHLLSPGLAKSIAMTVGEKSTMTQNPNFKYEDWGLTFGSMNFVKAVCHNLWLSLGQEAFEGGQAPDSPVMLMNGERSSIGKFAKGARGLCVFLVYGFNLRSSAADAVDPRGACSFFVCVRAGSRPLVLSFGSCT